MFKVDLGVCNFRWGEGKKRLTNNAAFEERHEVEE